MAREVFAPKLGREHDAIPVSGVLHCIRGPEDLDPVRRERLEQLSAERDALVEGDGSQAELNAILVELAGIVFIREPFPDDIETMMVGEHLHDGPSDEAIRMTPDWLLAEWFDFFGERAGTRATAVLNRTARRQRSNGTKSQQTSRRSTAAVSRAG